MGSKRKLIFVTTNAHKVEEIKDLAKSEPGEITIEQLDYDYPELQLDDIEAVARESANYVRAQTGIKEPFFLEDSGLIIPALNGFPGPFSAFVFKTIGNEGILELMADKSGEERDATFKTVVAYCKSPKSAPMLFVGTVEGCIAGETRGSGGFGYDPIFEVQGVTFGEMRPAGKNNVSHRSRAFRKFLDFYSL
jgi:XTP/dITP diphosphohydrolase